MKTNTNNTCPQCGAPLPPDAPAGLCPACLMAMNLATPTIINEDGSAEYIKLKAPALEEIIPLFPQLEIIELLGKGGMGVVYKARQTKLDRMVALKILPKEIGETAGFAERFAREARALGKLNHSNIVTLFEFGHVDMEDGEPLYYFLMEYVDGLNLRRLLNNSRIEAREALSIVPQICDALQYAHDEGIVHRDIKPENILLDRRGNVKVADFGLAKIVEEKRFVVPPSGGSEAEQEDRLKAELQTSAEQQTSAELQTLPGKVMGTPKYMSPEQIEAPGTVDHRADIYALGVVFYQMLTGEMPGDKLQPPSKKVKIDVRLDEVVLRALEQKPDLRYQQASILKTQIETIASVPATPNIDGPEHSNAQRLVKGPAIGLIVTGAIEWILVSIFFIVLGLKVHEASRGVPVVFVFIPLLAMFLSGFIIYAGLKLMKLERRGAGLAAGILAIVMSPGNIIGLPIGIWALVVLNRREVREAFSANSNCRSEAGALKTEMKTILQAGKSSTGNQKSDAQPRFSRMAVVGSIWAPLACLYLGFLYPIHLGTIWKPELLWESLIIVVGIAGLTAPFGTTILGWISVSQIRRSAGKLYGLGLAVFDGLLFPLLALNGLIGWFLIGIFRLFADFYANTSNLNRPNVDPAFSTKLANLFADHHEVPILAAIITMIVVDFFIIRRIWRAANKPLTGENHLGGSSSSSTERHTSQSATPGSAPMSFERVQRIIIVRAVVLCIVASVFSSALMPVSLRFVVFGWGLLGLLLVAWKALAARVDPEKGLTALNPAHRIGLIHTIGILGAGAFLAFMNQGLDRTTNRLLAGMMIGAIFVNIMKLVMGLKVAPSRGFKQWAPFAVALIAGFLIAAGGFHLKTTNAPAAPTYTQDSTRTIQPDGMVRGTVTVEYENQTEKEIRTERFINSDFIHVDSIRDAEGRPLVFKARPGKGNIIEYNLTFNEPIPPGGLVSFTCEGIETGAIKATGEPDIFEYSMKHWPGHSGTTRRIERHILPPGTVLIDKFPPDLKKEKLGDPIELHIDRNIPPGGHIEVRYRYRLADAETLAEANIPAFGPVIELELQASSVLADCFLDLDNAQVLSAPRKLVEALKNKGQLSDGNPQVRSIAAWARDNGIDCFLRTDEAAPLQILQGYAIATEVDFDSVTPQEVTQTAKMLNELYFQMEDSSLDFHMPLAFKGSEAQRAVFRTREGGIGILEITDVIEKPHGVKIRYKRLLNKVEQLQAVMLFNDMEIFGFEKAFEARDLSAARVSIDHTKKMLINFNDTVLGTNSTVYSEILLAIAALEQALDGGDWDEIAQVAKHQARECRNICDQMVMDRESSTERSYLGRWELTAEGETIGMRFDEGGRCIFFHGEEDEEDEGTWQVQDGKLFFDIDDEKCTGWLMDQDTLLIRGENTLPWPLKRSDSAGNASGADVSERDREIGSSDAIPVARKTIDPDEKISDWIMDQEPVSSVGTPEARVMVEPDETRSTFGPVVEQVLYDSLENGNTCLDLDSTKIFDLDKILKQLSEESQLRFFEESGFDLYLNHNPWRFLTPGNNVLRLVKVENSAWDLMGAKQLGHELIRGDSGIHTESVPEVTIFALETNAVMPLTYAFATATGNRGLMQVTEFIEDPISTKIRYKLVKKESDVRISRQLKDLPRPEQMRAGREHVVQSGHTLSMIAQAYGTTVLAIKQANNLKSDSIRVGHKLFIPESRSPAGTPPDFDDMHFWQDQIQNYMTAVKTMEGEFVINRKTFKQAETNQYRVKVDFEWEREKAWYDYAVTRIDPEEGSMVRHIRNDQEIWRVDRNTAHRSAIGKERLIAPMHRSGFSPEDVWWPGDAQDIGQIAELVSSDLLRALKYQQKWDLLPVSHQLNEDGTHDLILMKVEFEGNNEYEIFLTIAWDNGFKLLQAGGRIGDSSDRVMTAWSDHQKVGRFWIPGKAVTYRYDPETQLDPKPRIEEVKTVVANRMVINQPIPSDRFTYIPEPGTGVQDDIKQTHYTAWPDLKKIKAGGGKERISISGIVYQDGIPAEGMSISTFTKISPDSESDRSVRSKTDKEGRYLLDGLIPGFTYRVKVKSVSGNQRTLSVKTDPAGVDVCDSDIEMVSGYILSGSVCHPDGSPSKGAVVLVKGFNEVRTDQEGRYSIAGLKANVPYTLQAAAKGCAPFRVDYTPRLNAQGEPQALDIQLEKEHVLTGRLVDKHGDPLKKVRLFGFHECFVGSQWRWCNTHTDENGYFRLGNLGDASYNISFGRFGSKRFSASESPILLHTVNDHFALRPKAGRALVDAETRAIADRIDQRFLDLYRLESVCRGGHSSMTKEIKEKLNRFASADGTTQHEILAALGNMDAVEATALFQKQIQKASDKTAVLLAIRGLGRISDVESSSVLIDQLADDDPEIAAYARVALAELSGTYFGVDEKAWTHWRSRYLENRSKLKTLGPERLLQTMLKAAGEGDVETAVAAFLPGTDAAARFRTAFKKNPEWFKAAYEAITWPDHTHNGAVVVVSGCISERTWEFPLSMNTSLEGTTLNAGKPVLNYNGLFREVDREWWLIDLNSNLMHSYYHAGSGYGPLLY